MGALAILGGGKQDDAKEVQRQLAKKMCERQIEGLRTATPDQVERINDLLKEQLGNSVLTRDYRADAKERARQLSRDAMTRGVDKALEMATVFAKGDKRQELRHWLGEAKTLLRGAIKYGADESFVKASKMTMEVLRETGGVQSHGKPTRAKPGSPD